MFNSQKINNDPTPWERWHKDLGQMGRFARLFPQPRRWSIEYKPRPKYDNNPNPILLIAREAQRQGYLSTFATGFIEEVETQIELGFEIADQVVHARKVLTRLVNVYETEQ